MELIDALQATHAKCYLLLQRAADAVNKRETPERFEVIYSLLNKMVEETFTHYHINFFLNHDYFALMARAFKIYSFRGSMVSLKLLSLAQLIISNTRTAADLNAMVELKGFQEFFSVDFNYEKVEEVGDYYVNLIKSIVLKADGRTSYAHIRGPLLRSLDLAGSHDSLKKTTVRNIVLAVVNQRYDSFGEFLQEEAFKRFFFDVLREIGSRFFAFDDQVLKLAAKELQNNVFEIQEALQFIDELTCFVQNEDALCFMTNAFLIVVVVHLVLPTFRADIKIKDGKRPGINAVLFLINLMLNELKNEALNITFAVDVIMKDKVYVVPDPVLLDSNVIFGKSYELLSQTMLFKDPRSQTLFHSRSENLVAVSQIKRPNNLIKTLAEDPGSRVITADSIVPALHTRQQVTEVPISHCGGKVFQTLWAFFRSKDDNMVLITSNILIFLFTNYRIIIDQDIERVTERLFELLNTEPLLRHATNKNIGRLLHIIYDQLRFEESFSINITKLYAARLARAKTHFEAPRSREFFIANFRPIFEDPASEECVLSFQVQQLNWAALINYTFTTIESKAFSTMDLDWRMDLSDEETVQVELRVLAIVRSLRSFILGKQVKEKRPESLSKLIAAETATSPQFQVTEGATLTIDFSQKQDIKRFFGGKGASSGGNKLFIAALGPDLLLLEESSTEKGVYTVVFKEFFCGVNAYISKHESKQLVLKLRSRNMYWSMFFPTSQIASQSLATLDTVWKGLRDQELKTVGDLLAKLEGEVGSHPVRSYRIEF